MNIFVLDKDPIIAAQRICDKHLVKMPLESTQLWSTVARRAGILEGYKETHVSHPCCVWLQLSLTNRLWFYRYTEALFDEFLLRRNKEHSSRKIFDKLAEKVFNKRDNWFTPTLIKKPDPLSLQWYEELERNNKLSIFRYDKNAIDLKFFTTNIGWVDWYTAMPEHCRIENDPVASYVNYYVKEKKDIVNYNWMPSRGLWYEAIQST